MKVKYKTKYFCSTLIDFSISHTEIFLSLVSRGVIPSYALFDPRYCVRYRVNDFGISELEIGFAEDDWCIN